MGSGAGHALTTGDQNIVIGNPNAVAGESNTMRIGGSSQTRAFIAGIRGVATGNADAIAVLIDSDGQLGTLSSSRRFKKEIKPMDKASEAILGLKPVTFHYKSDGTATPQFGLIAEEVAEANPDLVVHDEKGEIYSVRYEAVNAMLLNEFLKEHARGEEQDRKIQKQEATITQLKKDLDALVARLKEHDSKIQRVTDQLD
jgi:endosialidase-like protein